MAKKKKKGKKKEKSVNHIVTPFITREPGYRNELKKKKKIKSLGKRGDGGRFLGLFVIFRKFIIEIGALVDKGNGDGPPWSFIIAVMMIRCSLFLNQPFL